MAHARALVAPPSLCIFHTAFIRRRMVLALVQDWASSAAVPLMGGPRVGATSNPRPGIRAEGAPDSSIRWAPVHSLELITLRSSRPFADWTAVRCAVALSCTLSCFVVTHPVPPVCDQCLRRECLWLTPGRSLLLRLFVSSILRLSEDVWFLHLCKIGRLLQQSL